MAGTASFAAKRQPTLWDGIPLTEDCIGMPNLVEAFRGLYYHLYTNSNASRAERIVEDLALILLLKLAVEKMDAHELVARYLEGTAHANDALMPLLHEAFPDLVDTQQHFSLGDVALRDTLERLNSVYLSSAPAHVLGEAFQALIGPRLRGDKGQFFTPRSLVRAMVQIVAPKPGESVLDPACGTAGFLVESHAYQLALAGAGVPIGRLVGIDKDHDLSRLATALLQITTSDRGTVYNFNSLDIDQWDNTLGNGTLFDVILTNPPFGARIGLRDRAILKRYAFGHQWVQLRGTTTWQQTTTVSNVQDPQTLFLELCVRKLKPGGRLGIVLPEGMFGNKGQGYVWEWLTWQGHIFALLDCPRTTFQPGTDTKTNVLFFQKALTPMDSASADLCRTKIAVALHCGHDRRGRVRLNDGRTHPDDFASLGPAYHNHQDNCPGWQEVTLTKQNYLVPRYYAEQRSVTVQEAELTRGAVTITLGEMVERSILAIRKGHEVGSEAYGTGDIPFVRTSDLSNFEISTDPTTSVNDEVYAKYSKLQRLMVGDILMVVDGRYRIGTTAMLTETNFLCVAQSHLRILSVLKPRVITPYELLYALNLPSVRLRIRDLVFVQSTLGTLGKRLLELKIPLLHGDGPWKERVAQFESLLKGRDQLLTELKSMSGPDYDL